MNPATPADYPGGFAGDAFHEMNLPLGLM